MNSVRWVREFDLLQRLWGREYSTTIRRSMWLDLVRKTVLVEGDEPGREWGPSCRGPSGPRCVTGCGSEQDEKPLEGFEHGVMKIESCADKFLPPVVWSSDAGRKQPLYRPIQCSERMVETWAGVALDSERPALIETWNHIVFILHNIFMTYPCWSINRTWWYNGCVLWGKRRVRCALTSFWLEQLMDGGVIFWNQEPVGREGIQKWSSYNQGWLDMQAEMTLSLESGLEAEESLPLHGDEINDLKT